MILGETLFKLRSYTPIPVVLAILFLPGSFSCFLPGREDHLHLSIILICGFAVMAAGEIIRFISLAHSSPATRTRNVGASRLFCGGPYAHVRNPLYIGNYLIMAGFVLMSWTAFPYLLIISTILFVFQYYFIIKLEEEALEKDLGDIYIDYKKKVPRIFPRLRPQVFDNDREPDHKRAVKSEKNSIRAEIIMMILIFVRWYFIIC